MKKFISIISAVLFFYCIAFFGNSYAADNILAFPGAEGGGKYTKGARASSSPTVYHVTNLNASGSGSFKDAVSKSGRIIVFDVGGTIELNDTLTISQNNLTILGQTAPGDGITFAGGDILLSSGVQQVIMRYIRVRPTDENGGEPDGIGGRWNKNIIIDHCSTSWGVDELLTIYAGSSENSTQGSNITVQNTISSESLRMSNHFKGAHGYGAIVGATNSTWHHNLLAHHDSRSPRLDRELHNTDIRNNVIYNWGQTNSAYGGEPYSYNNKTQNGTEVNYADNYYKYGPATANNLRNRIFQFSDPKTAGKEKSQFYFAGNYVFGYPDVTNDNTKGLKDIGYATLMTSAFDMGDYALTEAQNAEEAYETVLGDVGATLPKRDAIDARIVADVINQTGRIINNANEVGGLINTETTKHTFVIPQDWKDENNMGSASETDIVKNGEFAGYTWIEAYVNDWTAQQAHPTNPSITVISPAIQDMNSLGTQNKWAVINDTENLNYSATATPADGTSITKIEIYDGKNLIKTINSAYVNESLTLSAGTHYLTSRAYNNNGESTQSPTSIVYVKSTFGTGIYKHTQIGTTAFNNQGGSWINNGVYTIMGSGTIGAEKTSDKCDFMYREVTGDFDISVKAEQIPKFENGELCGIMMRETLEPNSKMAMLSDGWLKYGQNVKTITRTSTGGRANIQWFKNSSGTVIENNDSYDTNTAQYRVPQYLRMQRTGNTITYSVSDNGISWTNNPRQPLSVTFSDLSDTVYVGLAVDSAQGTPTKEYMAEAKFSNLTIADSNPTPTPEPLYEITTEDNIQNGTIKIQTSSGTAGATSNSIVWKAEKNLPSDFIEGTTNIYGDGKAVVPLNGTDEKDGTITFHDAVQGFTFTGSDGTSTTYFKNYLNNPTANPPFSDNNQPTGNVFSFKTAADGYLTLRLYIYVGKTFYLYDNSTQQYIVNGMVTDKEDIYEFTIECTAGSEYYAWARGSKIGLETAAYSPKIPAAKNGEIVKISTTPSSGYIADKISVTTINGDTINVTRQSDNSYTFIMPAAQVLVSADFIPEGTPTHTPDPTAVPTPGIYYTKPPILQDGIVSASVMSYGTSQNAAFIIGIYNSSTNVLESMRIEHIKPESLTDVNISIDTINDKKIKVMLWDENMIPLDNVIELN